MNIGMLIFPDMTQLDFTGPHEVFAQFPDCTIKVVAQNAGPVTARGGLQIVADTALAGAPRFDLIFVPGGAGVGALLENREVLEFLRAQARDAKYVTSVCTGALALGAAGLLQGYRATTHWLSLDLLEFFGALPARERVVIDRNRITGGGVTAGIDFALTVAAELFGANAAKAMQLMIEYNPAPPFTCGHPDTADAAIVADIRAKMAPLQATRVEQAKRAARMYCGGVGNA